MPTGFAELPVLNILLRKSKRSGRGYGYGDDGIPSDKVVDQD